MSDEVWRKKEKKEDRNKGCLTDTLSFSQIFFLPIFSIIPTFSPPLHLFPVYLFLFLSSHSHHVFLHLVLSLLFPSFLVSLSVRRVYVMTGDWISAHASSLITRTANCYSSYLLKKKKSYSFTVNMVTLFKVSKYKINLFLINNPIVYNNDNKKSFFLKLFIPCLSLHICFTVLKIDSV